MIKRPGAARARSIAIIGSFRQHYAPVMTAWNVFHEAGWTITSPKGAPVIDQSVEFVRFESDDPDWDDEMVQMIAMHRILGASLVYVVAPDGYVGRTTCYEIGRILHADRPLYFSEQPKDLPVTVPDAHVLHPADLVEAIERHAPASTLSALEGRYGDLERGLLRGDYEQL